MKAIINKKWSLILVPIISVFFFVTIITAAPLAIQATMNNQEIQTISVVSAEAAKKPIEPKTETQTVPSPVKTVPNSIPVPAKTNSTSTSVKKVQPQQPSRSTSTSSVAPSKSTSTSASNNKITSSKSSSQTKASAIIATSKQYIGVNYVYGGTTPTGFDCSGFVQYVFAKNGISLPRVSRDRFKVGTPVSFRNLQSGDLVFFSLAKNGVVDHMGIYVGNGQFINASSSKGVTIYTFGPYWKSAYVGAKRVL